MNRRSFIKAVTFYGGSIVAGLTLNPFGFLQKTAKADPVSATKKYRWCYCDDVELKKMLHETRSLRKRGNVGKKENVAIVVPGSIDTFERQLVIHGRYRYVPLEDLGIETSLIRGMPVISYSGAKRLHRLKMLGKRIYAT